MAKGKVSCPQCSKVLDKIDYKSWGTMRFRSTLGGYEEDDSPGNCDLEFTCPHCEAELDPDMVLV
jgi:hypothetical protein